jgi:hypothetical protein
MACACAIVACSAKRAPEQAPEPKPYAVIDGLATRCIVGSTTSSPIYRVRDLGKQGVPELTKMMRRTVASIVKYYHPSTLRFTIIGEAHLDMRDLYVFDPYPSALCSGSGFFLLNDRSCQTFFLPADPDDLTATAPDCYNRKRPWIPDDKGTTNGSWSDGNNH